MNLGEVICPLCSKYFDNQEHIPHMLPACGHTFCSKCIKNILEKISVNECFVCPEDRISWNIEKKDISSFPKNYILLNYLDKRRTNSAFIGNQKPFYYSSTSYDISGISPSKLEISMQSTPTNTNSNNISMTQLPDIDSNHLCKEHYRKLEIVCIDHKCRICSKCALFGNHRNHNIKSEEDVIKEINIRVEVIWEIFKIIEQNQNKMINQNYIDKWNALLKTRYNEIIKEVQEQFEEYIQLIQAKQKNLINEINQKFNLFEKKISDLNQLPKDIDDRIQSWKTIVVDKLAILEKKKEENEIAYELLEQKFSNNKEEDIVIKGEKLLNDLESLFDQSSKYINQYLKETSVVFNNSFKNLIDNSCIFVTNISNGFNLDWKNILAKETSNQQQQQQQQQYASVTTNGNNIQNNDDFLENYRSLPIKKGDEDLLNFENSGLSLLDFPEPSFTESRRISPTNSVRKIFQPMKSFGDKPQKMNNPTHKVSSSYVFENFISQLDTSTSSKDFVRRSMSPNIKMSTNRRDQSPLDGNTSSNMRLSINKKKVNYTIPFKFGPILELMKNGTIENVDLTGADLGDNGVAYIAELLLKCKNVKSLKLVKNKITDDGLQFLIKSLLTNTSITTLNLTQNLLTDKSLDALIALFETNQCIKKIYLSQNSINSRNSKYKIRDMNCLGVEVYL